MTTVMAHQGSVNDRLPGQRRRLQIVLLGVLLLVTVGSLLHTHYIRAQLSASTSKLTGLQNTQRLAKHFSERYSALSSSANSAENSRVFWTDLLQTALAEFAGSQIEFSIADPSPVPVEFSGRLSNVVVHEYLMQLSAKIENDAALVNLLRRIEAISVDFIRNRSCYIKRTEQHDSINLDCVYSILDLTTKDHTQ